jgi:hypothetical protein
MTPGFIKRHYDFVVSVGTLAAGQQIVVTGTLPTDAPFVLKARAMRCRYVPAFAGVNVGQTLLDEVNWKFAGPDNNYYAQDMTPFHLEADNWGQTPNGCWLQTPVVYQPGAPIESQVLNTGAVDIPGLVLYFRGFQLFPCGAVPGLTYPSVMATNDFQVVTGPGTPERPGSTVTTPLLQVTDLQRFLQMKPSPDADFVLRCAQCLSVSGLASLDPYPLETFITLMDWNQKAYSNAAVHTDILFGTSKTWPSTAAGLPGLNGPQSGLFTPEIFIPKNSFLYYDLSRADQYLADDYGMLPEPASFFIGWKGAKVYQA